ncbi:hypothetical protein Taro_049966, partial [Colocasia esculenta]|nr:hypothetical protein [Colocasia esculenta]
VKCVDTVYGRVDTRPSFQEIYLSDWDSVSTQSVVVSTLDPASRRPFLHKWDSVSTHSVCVDTVSGRVDTRPSIQKTFFAQMGQCVDTLSGSVDTLRLKSQHLIYLDTWPLGVQGNLPRYPTQDKSQEHSGRRDEEREKGICIQRSRAAPPREEEGKVGEEEEKELVIAAVLIKKCLSHGAQGLVNLLNSQVVCGVGCRAYLLGFFELLHSKRSESSCSSLYCTCASGSSIVRRWT